MMMAMEMMARRMRVILFWRALWGDEWMGGGGMREWMGGGGMREWMRKGGMFS